MDNQHRKITGYRDLTQEEIDLMNEIKLKFAEIGDLITKVNEVNRGLTQTADEDMEALLRVAEPHRWSSIARTHAQEASMALTRAVAKPTFF
jgi:hypothetical protein